MTTNAQLLLTPSDLHGSVQEALKGSLGKLAGCRRALFFSGGFDSMLLARLMQSCGARVIAVTVRFDVFNPCTVTESILLAQRMGLPHYILHVTLREFLSAFKSLPSLIEKPIFDLDLILTHAALRKYDPKIAGKIFVSGMAADQLLGDETLGNSNIVEDEQHWVAKAHGYRFIFPFLSQQVKVLSRQFPAAAKKNKKLLREMISDDQRALVPGCSGRREIQIPAQVRRLLVRIYSGGKSVEADDKTLHQVIERLWLKKSRNRSHAG